MRKPILSLFCFCCVVWSAESAQCQLQQSLSPNKLDRSIILSVKKNLEQKLEQGIDFVYSLSSCRMKDVGHFLEVYSANIRDLSIGISCLFLAMRLGGFLFEGQKLLSQINSLLDPLDESQKPGQGSIREIMARIQMAVRHPPFLLRCLGIKG